jgi:hypothetical protein
VLSAFDPYVRELERLSIAGPRGDTAHFALHLDGEAGRRLRSVVPIDELRRVGAFFTGDALAARLLEHVPVAAGCYIDPACGCGDLLLAASARLPVRCSLEQTLREWNERLSGRDLVPQFVRGARPTEGHPHPARLLTGIATGDGLALRPQAGTAVLVNPPYGQVAAPTGCAWTAGLTTEAAVFLDALLDVCAPGVYVAAVLPEVLRAGSRYGRFRAATERRLDVAVVEPAGVFDALTDVDVFLLAGRVAGVTVPPPASWTAPAPAARLQDICDVRVGAVVANRDPHSGSWRLYVDARDLGGAAELRPTRRRRFRGSVVEPPFVVVGRTNRPVCRDGPRLRPTIVVSDRPVAIENHLIALVPHDHTHDGCRKIVAIVESQRASAFLDERLRCRHLTVRALRDLPR